MTANKVFKEMSVHFCSISCPRTTISWLGSSTKGWLFMVSMERGSFLRMLTSLEQIQPGLARCYFQVEVRGGAPPRLLFIALDAD